MEQVIPDQKIKVAAGGLGNVAGLYVERLPCKGKFVFAKVSGINYQNFEPSQPILFSDGTEVDVSTCMHSDNNLEFVAVEHPMFMARTKANIYPDGRTPEQVRA